MHISSLSKTELFKLCKELIKSEKTSRIVTINSLMLRKAWKDKTFHGAIKDADLYVADGVGIYWALRLLEKQKVTLYPGIDILNDIVIEGYKVFFFGAAEGVCKRAADKLISKYNNIDICGTEAGFFSKKDESKILENINNCNPDVLFVALDMQTQESWIKQKLPDLNVKLIMGVGGSFDVISGNLPRAPYIMRKFGLEWLWRLCIQPWRLTRMLQLPLFILDIIIRFFRKQGLFDN